MVPGSPHLRLVVLAALLLATFAARADVVHLKNGREVQGEVREDGDALVVRTAHGEMRIPRRDVERVERESPAATALRQARAAASAGDAQAATRLLERALGLAGGAAAGTPDAEVAIRARAELEALRAAPPPAGGDDPPRPLASPSWRGDDPFVEEEREALIRELEQAAAARPDLRGRLAQHLYERARRRHDARECRLAVSDLRRAAAHAEEADLLALASHERRCRLEVAAVALRRGDGALARAAVAALCAGEGALARLEDGGELRRARYQLGRAEELLRHPAEARAAFLLALGDVSVPRDRDLALVRELARLASAGIPVDATTPGIAPGWRWVQTAHFSVLLEQGAQVGDDGDGAGGGHGGQSIEGRLEAARADVIARLSLRRLDDEVRIALICFASEGSYQRSAGARAWSAGHATRLRSGVIGDEVVPTIYLHTGGDHESRLRHELAHIVVGDALDDALLPMWAAEGVAIHAETDASRARWRAHARALDARGALAATRDALGRMLLPLTDDAAVIGAFYVQAGLLFDVLVERAGGVQRALGAAQRVNEGGAESALRSVGVRLDEYEADVRRALAR